jgi:predicted nucleotidyltransferase
VTSDLDASLAAWAANQPEILWLFVFGSRARDDARPDSDLDLAFELDDSRESQLTVLVCNSGQWQRELSALTGLQVRDLHLWDDPEVSGPVKEVYAREANDFDPASFDLKNLRRVNGYWAYGQKPVGERGAASVILEAAGFAIDRLVSCEDANLPPDCAATVDGVHTGIEVTELVHRKSLDRSLKSKSKSVFWFPWDQGTFCAKIRGIIAEKEAGAPRWQGGPYERWLLVIPTDRFQTRFFSDAVLGLPPLPATDFFPTFRLTLDKP